MKTKILCILILILSVSFSFYFGTKTNKAGAEIQLGCSNTVNQALNAKCKCPDPVFMEVGCTNQIEANQVNVKNATKIFINGKQYNVSNIEKNVSSIK